MTEKSEKKVNERYANFAEQAVKKDSALPVNVDGYAPKTGQKGNNLAQRIYAVDQLVDLPEPAINASIGCGNPLAIASIKEGERVLDLGSGGGIDCFMAARSAGESGFVIGVDATPAMIELANQNKVQQNVTNVEFRLGKIESLPVTTASIDLIISNCVIDISAEKDAVFAEAFRVLKPGGRIAITDTVLLGEIPPSLKANIDIWAGAVITPLISLQAFIQYMIDAGFIEIRVDSLTSYGLENFEDLDTNSREVLTRGIEWTPLPANTGLYSAAIWARKP